MSGLSTPQPAIGFGQPFTRRDLGFMPFDGRRYELIDGMLVVTAAPGMRHRNAALKLGELLRQHCPAHLKVLAAPFAVLLGDGTELQPDLLVGRCRDLSGRGLHAAPVLAVEVVSGGTGMIDRTLKRLRFELEGTPSFWILEPSVRPAAAALEIWQLNETGAYDLVAEVVGEQAHTVTQPYQVTIRPADLVR